ncbi:hypothetical protein ACH5RR_000150 [Cinchona calisaya]|uniref:Uncharacterized protein n=1 Tax=Cinchona calisaya TaxID=153742 RepID=A0ABD3AZZ4_9GENT
MVGIWTYYMPFYQLSVSVAKAGAHVSLVSTPKNIQKLPKLPPDVSVLIDLIALPLPSIDRNLLPEDAEATVDVPFDNIHCCCGIPSTVAYRKLEAIGIYAGLYQQDASGLSGGQRTAKVLQAGKALAIRSCPDLESEYFNLLAKINGKPAISVGFLPPGRSTETLNVFTDKPWNEIFKWHDEQRLKSVVFVGFGRVPLMRSPSPRLALPDDTPKEI